MNKYKINDCFAAQYDDSDDVIQIIKYDSSTKLYKVVDGDGYEYKIEEGVFEIAYTPIEHDEFLIRSIQ
tara:strand:- start:1786 stop:1992 length:207 start_codon:yes stop_codon:yes gene_type:complete